MSHQWLLPSRLADNPLVWMLQVNGFIIDIRDAPVEVQRLAYEKGLIPFVPAERGGGDRESGIEAARLRGVVDPNRALWSAAGLVVLCVRRIAASYCVHRCFRCAAIGEAVSLGNLPLGLREQLGQCGRWGWVH